MPSVPVYLLLFGLALDFRNLNSDSPSTFNYIFLFIALVGAVAIIAPNLIAKNGKITVIKGGGAYIAISAILYVIWSFVAVLAGTSQSHPEFISVILPYVIYTAAMLAAVMALNRGYSARKLIRLLIIVSVLSCIWRVMVAVVFFDISLTRARWQILSPALPILLGGSAAGLLFTKHRLLPFLGISLFTFIIALSVTRGYIFSVLAVFLALLIVMRTEKSQRRNGLKAMGVSVIIGITLLAALFLAPSSLTSRWTHRLLQEQADSGQQITLIIRLAEFKGQFDALTSSITSFFVGKGLGSNYAYDDAFLLALAFYNSDEGLESANGADSTWGYPIYANGIIVGPMFLFSILWAVRVGFRKQIGMKGTLNSHFIRYFAPFSYMAYLGISVTGNILNERLGGVILGVLTALIIAPPEINKKYHALSSEVPENEHLDKRNYPESGSKATPA
jgi:hypothetical protein